MARELIAIKIYANELELSRKKYITKSPILPANLLKQQRGGLRLAVKHNSNYETQKGAELLTKMRATHCRTALGTTFVGLLNVS